MMTINKQINIDKIICTHFDKTKLCAFIFAVFKNASIWQFMDIPENETIPQQSATDKEVRDSDNSLAPRVTSKMPCKKPLMQFLSMFKGDNACDNMLLIIVIKLKLSKSSARR